MSTIIFKSNGNVYQYLAFLAQNGEGTLWERSRNYQKKIGHDERTARNGTVTVTVQERNNYCNEFGPNY